jgi:tetratricopeptide (TPR) repeat protein
MVRQAFDYSSGGTMRWQVFWARYRERALRSSDVSTLLTFALLATTDRDDQTIRRDFGAIVRQLRELETDDGFAVLPIIDVMIEARHFDHAHAALSPYLTDEPAAGVLLRAATIAEGRSRHGEAAAFVERLLVELDDEPVSLADLRTLYGRLIDDLERATLTDSNRDELVARAQRAVSQWRALDADNPAIDRRIATLLYGVQRPDDAWRQLSSTIERHPMEGEAYQAVAEVLQGEGQLERADQLWERAVAVDPTNPTWLLRRAQVALALGQREQANVHIRSITEGTWQDRFFNIVNQANQLREQSEAEQNR